MALVSFVALAAWIYLLLGRGLFWLTRERDDAAGPIDEARFERRNLPRLGEVARRGLRRDEVDLSPPEPWPSVVAVVPARNEADVVARSIGSLLAQDYPGDFRIILVDDDSSDGTASAAAALQGLRSRLRVVRGAPLAPGWTGKLWAVAQGIEQARQAPGPPDFLLLTDADIAHAPDNLRSLVERARAGRLVLASLMARLTVETWAERLLVPAFVFFFAMLYPFAWVNDPRSGTAAAAGGCMLVDRAGLEAAGGIQAIAGDLIDDCALAALLKRHGPIWLGLTDRARSQRPYSSFAAIGRMVSRSAFAQLGFSAWLLAATVAGMALLYIAPPVIALFGTGVARIAGAAAWVAMAASYQPMLHFYRLGFWRGALLPVIAACYVAFTLTSAIDHWRGRGGMWKGRAQAMGTPT